MKNKKELSKVVVWHGRSLTGRDVFPHSGVWHWTSKNRPGGSIYINLLDGRKFLVNVGDIILIREDGTYVDDLNYLSRYES